MKGMRTTLSQVFFLPVPVGFEVRWVEGTQGGVFLDLYMGGWVGGWIEEK